MIINVTIDQNLIINKFQVHSPVLIRVNLIENYHEIRPNWTQWTFLSLSFSPLLFLFQFGDVPWHWWGTSQLTQAPVASLSCLRNSHADWLWTVTAALNCLTILDWLTYVTSNQWEKVIFGSLQWLVLPGTRVSLVNVMLCVLTFTVWASDGRRILLLWQLQVGMEGKGALPAWRFFPKTLRGRVSSYGTCSCLPLLGSFQ